ncbi:hypothetical protein BC829DRAFT_399585, partial [Chytridium lagenaria]
MSSFLFFFYSISFSFYHLGFNVLFLQPFIQFQIQQMILPFCFFFFVSTTITSFSNLSLFFVCVVFGGWAGL